jgi:probable FeS assembly SUF system protein SufT
MDQPSTLILLRDCQATQIPAGSPATIPSGTEVTVTQTLGGTYTISVPGMGLFRVNAGEAGALGLEPLPPTRATHAEGSLNDQMVWDTLRTCFDPEIPVNIVDLGLIYDMQIREAAAGKAVDVKMTLTAQGCGMGPAIAGDAQQKLMALPGVTEANVDVVWEPQWHHSMITEQGRKVLGLD